MKATKILLSIVGIVILLVGGLAWYVANNINDIVRDVVETAGTDVLQTQVALKHVDIKLIDGSAELGSFSIKNYADFNEPELLLFDTIKVDIDLDSINKDVKVLDEVTISGISIVAEQKGTTTNLQTLLKKLPRSESSSADKSETSSGTDVKLAIKTLNFVDNSVSLVLEDYGTHKLKLPKIVRTNLGSAEEGLTPEQLAKEVVEPLIEQAKDQIEKEVANLAKKRLEEEYGEQIEAEKEKLKKQAEEALGADADEIEEQLKGLKKLL